jgi:CubicO group peptidase (beta-lactamase class C family)
MQRRAYFAAALGAALLAVAAQPVLAGEAPSSPAKPAATALSATTTPEAAGFDSGRLKKLDDYMAKTVADGRVAGMTTLLARHGKVVEFKTYGKTSLATGQAMPTDEIFRI